MNKTKNEEKETNEKSFLIRYWGLWELNTTKEPIKVTKLLKLLDR